MAAKTTTTGAKPRGNTKPRPPIREARKAAVAEVLAEHADDIDAKVADYLAAKGFVPETKTVYVQSTSTNGAAE